MELLEGLYTRRSVREFTGEPVSEKELTEIMKAGSWAPSGLNNQPWRFVPVTDGALMEELAKLTRYRRIVEEAPACIVVLVDPAAMYHDMKDYMAMGACVQNMLLAAHALDVGAVWLGQILAEEAAVKRLIGIPGDLRLAAVVALGRPAHRNQSSQRRPLTELVLGNRDE